jgi:hypothetical protein
LNAAWHIVSQSAALLLVFVLSSSNAPAQAPPLSSNSSDKQYWLFNLTSYGYLPSAGVGYVCPILVADRGWMHLEARYNYEDLRTGSLWAGYTLTAGKRLALIVTPMIGGVFGRTTGVAPGLQASLTYHKVQFSLSNEYVFKKEQQSTSFYYDWPQLSYSPVDWLHIGLVAQRTKIYRSDIDTQRGVFFGVSHRKTDFTTYVLNGGSKGTVLLPAAGIRF